MVALEEPARAHDVCEGRTPSSSAAWPLDGALCGRKGTRTLWGDGLDRAELFMDGNYVGELPVKVQLSEGRHAFRVKAAEGDEFTVTRDLHFDVQGIGITIELSR